jgi:two-component system, response regulator RegA
MSTSMNLLLVDDDDDFRLVLTTALQKRGFVVHCAQHVEAAQELIKKMTPQFAVVDLKMPGPSGLVLVSQLKQLNNDMRIVMLTGFASVATAVEAIKLGATHYLAKPADADEIVAAFGRDTGNTETEPAVAPMSVPRVEWEHIQRVLNEHDGNISAAARSLNMHRRTLQRKLLKNPAKR